MSQISQIKKIYHAAIYVRLSKEDGAVASHEKTESNSIANQKSLIRDFLKNKNDIEVVQEYVDDGFSGSNFERPAFQMMLEDIKKGKIDCVDFDDCYKECLNVIASQGHSVEVDSTGKLNIRLKEAV